nr:MAG TPA: hypothetical protein [Caudoviricetes sp.]
MAGSKAGLGARKSRLYSFWFDFQMESIRPDGWLRIYAFLCNAPASFAR